MYTAKRRGNYSSNKSKCISILHITFNERLRDFAMILSECKQNSFWHSENKTFKKYEICANVVDLHLYFDCVESCAILVWPVFLGGQKQSKFHVFKPISSPTYKLSRRTRMFLSIHRCQTNYSVKRKFYLHVLVRLNWHEIREPI